MSDIREVEILYVDSIYGIKAPRDPSFIPATRKDRPELRSLRIGSGVDKFSASVALSITSNVDVGSRFKFRSLSSIVSCENMPTDVGGCFVSGLEDMVGIDMVSKIHGKVEWLNNSSMLSSKIRNLRVSVVAFIIHCILREAG